MQDSAQGAAPAIRQMSWLADDRHEGQGFKAGEVIFSTGETAGVMYVVRGGEVEILVHDKVVDTVGHGGIIGEMALIDHAPRSATARAKSDCDLLPVDERKFLFLVDEAPFFALDVMRILANRLRAMNETV